MRPKQTISSKLSKTYGYKVIHPHDEIMMIARFLRNGTSRIKDAIELLEINAQNYPASAINFETSFHHIVIQFDQFFENFQ